MRHDDPAYLSPDQRFGELARLLAIGVRRLLSGRPSPLLSTSAEPPEALETSLELGAPKSVTVHTG